jgi:dCTP deaminase
MGVLSDRQIKAGVKITPFVDGQRRDGVISYGLTSYGYDVRAGYRFQIFTDVNCSVIDPKAFDKRMLVDVDLTPGHDWKPNPEEKVGSVCSKCGLRIAYSIKAFPDAWAHNTACHKIPNHILIPPNSFALAETVEHLEIPRDTLAIVLGKSTYARCGLVVNCTPLEPEWRGKVTMELSNTTPLPIKVYAGEGIAQVYFLRSDDPHLFGCQVSYADKKGRYLDQTGITHPFVEKESQKQ